METIADRIRRILRDQGISERELSRRSWLTETHIGTLLKTLTRDPGAIEWGTLREIAWGARVDESWLASGRGDPGQIPRPLETVGQRFKARCEEQKLPVSTLDSLLKLPKGHARALGRDQLALDHVTADRIARVLQCSPTWLLTGVGDKEASGEATETVEEKMLRVALDYPEWGAKMREALRRVRVSSDVVRFFADGGGKSPAATVDQLVDAMLAKQRQLNQEDERRARKEGRAQMPAAPEAQAPEAPKPAPAPREKARKPVRTGS